MTNLNKGKMKLTYQLLIIISLLGFTIACDSTNENSKEEKAKTEAKETPAKSKNDLELNDGERWSANPETTEGINNMMALMNSFSGFDNIDTYHSLSDSLNAEFNLILKQCTMEGDAHNQLHNFLFPMKEKFEKLSSKDLSEAKLAFEDLKKHLKLYSDYFE